ncbi:MAG: Ig-like domain-containing protein [Eubacterium sp.]
MRLKKRFKKIVVIMTATAMVVTSAQLGINVNADVNNQPLGANVALGKTITMPEAAYTVTDQSTEEKNATETENKKRNITRITDGNVSSGFQAVKLTPDGANNKYDPQEWVLDLEDTYSIDKIRMYWESGAWGKVYDIYVSETNDESEERWTKVVAESEGKGGELTYTFDSVTARYVKLALQERGANYGYNLYEIEVYTVGSVEPAVLENKALKATATASKSDDKDHLPEKAIDGDVKTMWRAPQYEKDEDYKNLKDENGKNIERSKEDIGSDYITLEWEEPQYFNVVKLIWGGGYVNNYKLQTSEDGETWIDIYNVTDARGGETRTITLDEPVTTKYLRMQNNATTSNEVHYRDELYEIQVYDETDIPVEGIFLSKTKIKLNIDDESALTSQLEININPTNAADKSVIWTSSDENIATVDENGLVTAVKAGIATITVTSVSNPEVTKECKVAVAGSMEKTNVTASKVEGTKNIDVVWTAVESAVNYEVYRVNDDTATKIYTGTEFNFVDEDLEPGTYSYYVKAIAPADSDIYADSISETTEGVLIPVDVTGIELSESEATIYVGDSKQLTAFVTPDNATNKEVIWLSDNEEVIYVDSNGNVIAMKEGSAVITVKTVDGEFTATCTVNAIPVDATSVTLNKEVDTVELGSTVQLEATVDPVNTTYTDITWNTADETIASVDENGLVTANAVGTTTITATAVSGVKAECTITVKIAPTEVVLDKTLVELTEGEKVTVTATVGPDNATDKTVQWYSDNTNVATVDENGNITAVKAGTANITVTTNDGNVTAICKVTVKKEEVSSTVKPGTDTPTTTAAPGVNTKAPAQAKIVKVTAKKKAAKKVKLSLKKISGAKGYEVQILKSKKAKKALARKNVKKIKVTIKSKKLKNKKKLYVKVRAYVLDAKGNKVYGKWSKVKKIKIKK